MNESETESIVSEEMVRVSRRDLMKIGDVLQRATSFHLFRDRMNAESHLAPSVRYSPLTTALEIALDSMTRLQNEARKS